ncbi:hypothetical protein FGG08_002335 [Glutinoglossum americanum]|uniref:C2H2-type domain-containing protein n=1 Tax=Glutinoglossum americanum TaxID=1670608 RepID=A0A9P8I9H6_9PEZI|nr:hypothetical protein FGG08_002335 [Glutinoglossum americanum]
MAGRSRNGSSNGRNKSRGGRSASTSSSEKQLPIEAFLPPQTGLATKRRCASSSRRPVESDSLSTRNLLASMAFQQRSSAGSSGGALHPDDTSVPGRPPPSSHTVGSKRPQSPRKYRQSTLATGRFHGGTVNQQPSTVAGHSSTPLISTSMLLLPDLEQLPRDAPSSTASKRTFSQLPTKYTQSKLTTNSFYQQANDAQRSPSIPGNSFAWPSNRSSTSNGLPPSTPSSQLINRGHSMQPIMNGTRSQLNVPQIGRPKVMGFTTKLPRQLSPKVASPTVPGVEQDQSSTEELSEGSNPSKVSLELTATPATDNHARPWTFVRRTTTEGRLQLPPAEKLEATRALSENQPRCRYCLMYFVTDDALEKHINKKHPNGPTAECNWNNSGCDKRIRDPQQLKEHIRYEHEHAPPRHGNWAGPRIGGSVLRRCENCGDDFLLLRRHKPSCGNYHQCPVCNIRFSRTEGFGLHLKTHKTDRERFHCTWNGCCESYATRLGLQRHIRGFHNNESFLLLL